MVAVLVPRSIPRSTLSLSFEYFTNSNIFFECWIRLFYLLPTACVSLLIYI